MTHYDQATAMAYKLEQWSELRVLRNYEQEAHASEQRMATQKVPKQSFVKRCILAIGCLRFTDALDTP